MNKKLFLLLFLLSILLPLITGCGVSLTKTPYDLAVENGFEGSEEEWLASLKGESAYEIWLSQGNTGTIQDFLNALNVTVNDYNVTVNGSDNALASNAKALLSVCSIYAQFSKEVLIRNGYQWETVVQNYRSAGSGVIYQLDKTAGSAYIITNYHVVFDIENESTTSGVSNNIKLYLFGKEYDQYAIPATYVGGSVYYDIAVLKVENSDILRQSDAIAVTPMPEDREVTVGQTAIAVGNPEACGISATSGVVCVDSETIAMTSADGSKVTMRVMRIDTAINSGNSGGGLFNAKGELIGITNAKIVSTATENIAYAIPVKVATRVADNIIHYCENSSKKTMQRAVVGINVSTVASSAHYDSTTGTVSIMETVAVSSVNRGSVSEGVLKVGDIITAITIHGETYPITRTFMLSDTLLCARLGDEITFHVIRNGVEMTLSVTIDLSSIYSY